MIAAISRARRRDRGFTLIELLVVIVILGVISGVVVFAVRGTGDKGKRGGDRDRGPHPSHRAAWIYDPLGDAWGALPPQPLGVNRGTGFEGALLPDGRVIFAGGTAEPDENEHVGLFDPALHRLGKYPWLKVANCPAEGGKRRCGRMAAMPDGAGGKGKLIALNLSDAGAKRVKVWQLDLSLGAARLEKATAWAPLPDLPAPGLTATLITGTPAQCGSNCNKVIVGGPEGAFIWEPANAP